MFKNKNKSGSRGEADETLDFSRNRTMTNKSYSEAQGLDQENSGRIRRQKMRLFRRRVGKLLVVFFTTLVIIYIFYLNLITRPIVQIDGSDLSREVEVSIYQTVIVDYLKHYPVSRFKPFLDYNKLLSFIQTSNPEVLSVDKAGNNMIGSSNFRFSFREPIASWLIDNEQNFVDNSGVVFKNNYFKEPKLKVEDHNISTDIVGDTSVAISNRFLGFIGMVVAAYKQSDYEVDQIIIPKDKVKQVDVRLKNVGYIIKLSSDRSVGEQVEDSVRAINFFSDRNISPDYVDVRVNQRAAWR